MPKSKNELSIPSTKTNMEAPENLSIRVSFGFIYKN